MIELYISSEVQTSPQEIATKLAEQDVECQITPNYSANKGRQLEEGYQIKIFQMDEAKEFKEKVWNTLQPWLNLTCAFVKVENKYMGCVLNWPTVFVKSNCPIRQSDLQELNKDLPDNLPECQHKHF